MELKYEFYIDGTREQVWDAFVSPEGTRKTFFNCVIRSTFEVGAPYEYVGPGADGDETVHVHGKILQHEPHQVLSYTENAGPSYREYDAELDTRVTFTLETVGSCTKLTLVNDQIKPDHPSLQNAESSWWMILSNIKTFVETGKTLDFGW